MIQHLMLAAMVGVAGSGPTPFAPHMWQHHVPGPGPQIVLSVSDDIYHQGDAVRVTFRTDVDGYVTIFRVDTDGRVRLLFPQDPWDDNFVRGDRRYEVNSRHGDRAFVVDDYPGQGYLFAVASADPFDYSAFVRGDHWDYRTIADNGRIAGDPYQALSDLIDHIVPANYVAYSYDVAPYYVEQRYQYPRFLCYDCHGYSAYPYWDPYATSCIRFRVVIYDDPYYYPARAYRGTRVVYTRPVRPVPRFVFKDRSSGEPDIVHVRERPVDGAGRRVIDRGTTARDIPGGRVPAPVSPDPRLAPRRPADVPQTGTRAVPQTLPQGDGARRVVPPPARVPDRSTARPDTPRVLPPTPTLERREPARTPPTEVRPTTPERVQPPQRVTPPPKAEPRRTEPPKSAPPSRPTKPPPTRRHNG